jgi:hypothetical protein
MQVRLAVTERLQLFADKDGLAQRRPIHLRHGQYQCRCQVCVHPR